MEDIYNHKKHNGGAIPLHKNIFIRTMESDFLFEMLNHLHSGIPFGISHPASAAGLLHSEERRSGTRLEITMKFESIRYKARSTQHELSDQIGQGVTFVFTFLVSKSFFELDDKVETQNISISYPLCNPRCNESFHADMEWKHDGWQLDGYNLFENLKKGEAITYLSKADAIDLYDNHLFKWQAWRKFVVHKPQKFKSCPNKQFGLCSNPNCFKDKNCFKEAAKIKRETAKEDLRIRKREAKIKKHEDNARKEKRLARELAAKRESYKQEKFLYFFHKKSVNQVKIGRSKQPKERMNTLSNQAGEQFECLALWAKAGPLEPSIHERFRKQRVKGEWFDLTPTLKKFIEKGYKKVERVTFEEIGNL